MHLGAALVCAAVAGLGGLLMPRLVGALPEPAPAPDDGDYPPKVAYAELARAPRLGWWLALVGALTAGTVGLTLGWTWWLALGVLLAVVGPPLAYVDLRTWMLPVRIVGPSYAVAVVLVALAPLADGGGDDVVRAGLGWAAAGALYGVLWWARTGVGYGDVRLVGLLGLALAALGWGPWVVGLWAGSALGAIGWWPLRRLGLTTDRRLPFGPFLLAGSWVGVLVGGPAWTALTG